MNRLRFCHLANGLKPAIESNLFLALNRSLNMKCNLLKNKTNFSTTVKKNEMI